MSTGHYDETPINEYELSSVHALIAYVADTKSIHEDTVREIIKAKFGITEVTKLQQRDYESAIYFLVDLQPDKILN